MKPLLLHVATSALYSNNRIIKSSRRFDIASCNGVSPSESCIPGCAPFDKRVLHTSKWPLQTPKQKRKKQTYIYIYMSYVSIFDILFMISGIY